MTGEMTPAAIELALEIRREIEARYEEADQLRCRAVSAPRSKRISHSADSSWSIRATVSLPTPWSGNGNDKLRALAEAREERTRAQQRNDFVLDDAIRQRLAALTRISHAE